MLKSYYVYFLLIFLMTILGKFAWKLDMLNDTSKRVRVRWDLIFLILIFSVFCGIRYDVGVDYLTYLAYYEELRVGRLTYEPFEYIFHQINYGLSYLNLHFFWYFFTIAYLQMFFLILGLKNEKYLFQYMFFVFIAGGFYFTYMNELRQSLVISIFVFSIKYINEKKMLKYLLLIIIAFFIHRSAVILLPMYFFFRNNKDYFRNRKIQIVLLFVVLIISATQFLKYLVGLFEFVTGLIGMKNWNDLDEKLSFFQKNFTKGIRFYVPFFTSLIIILYSKKLKDYFSSSKFIIFYNLFFLGALFFILSFDNIALQRPARYFTFYQVIMTSFLLFYLGNAKRNRKINLLLFILIITMNIVVLHAFIESDHHTQFKFYWDIN